MKQKKNKPKILSIYLQPNAKENKTIGQQGEYLKICLKAPAIENKANKALIEFLSKELKIPKSQIKIIKGLKSRYKIVEIND